VEKDWYVVQALAAIQRADTGTCRLVFGGGTALSRAHRLTQRMSEDIDLKIVSEHMPSRSELRKLRDNVTRALRDAGFVFDPANPAHRESASESRYTVYRLPYQALVQGEGALRPEIKIETAVWPLRRPSIALDVISFCSEAFVRSPEVPSMLCSDLTETAAEKFVALTRPCGS
jgi:predicted nucleotidyltransferase component of viral defense system